MRTRTVGRKEDSGLQKRGYKQTKDGASVPTRDSYEKWLHDRRGLVLRNLALDREKWADDLTHGSFGRCCAGGVGIEGGLQITL